LGVEPTGENIFSYHKPEIVSYEEVPETHIKWEGNLIPASANQLALKYLNKRGIPVRIADEMNMKFCFSGWTKDAEDPNNKKQWIYVKDRLITPVYENKKLLSLEMRDVLGEAHFKEQMKEKGLDAEETKYKKVLYPKKSSTNTLFQYEHLDTTKPLYFLEGLMDLGVLRADTFFKNSTSVFGASIGQRQQFLLKKFPELIYIADHDKAGLISIWRLKEQLGRPFKYLFAPKGCKDVGDIPQKLKITVEDCRNRKWLATMKDSDNFDIIQEAIDSEFIDAEDLEMIKSLVESK
jgi:DNA primase